MLRAIDHVVHASRDLTAQAEFYRRIGFLVGARNQHPWGTENHIVQFDGHFIELIGQGAGFKPPVDLDPHVFSFAGHVAEQLAMGEGVSMLALKTDDASFVRNEYKKAGVGDFEPFHFERKGKKPDGTPSHVAFTLAFAQSKLMPDVSFFACQHHFPGEFYARDMQAHPNGSIGVAGVVMVAENPSAHAEFLSHVTGQRHMLATSMGIDLEIGPEQSIEVLTEPAFRHRFGDAAFSARNEPYVAATRIAVSDLELVADRLEEAGVSAAEVGRRLIIPPDKAFGTALVFEQATD